MLTFGHNSPPRQGRRSNFHFKMVHHLSVRGMCIPIIERGRTILNFPAMTPTNVEFLGARAPVGEGRHKVRNFNSNRNDMMTIYYNSKICTRSKQNHIKSKQSNNGNFIRSVCCKGEAREKYILQKFNVFFRP